MVEGIGGRRGHLVSRAPEDRWHPEVVKSISSATPWSDALELPPAVSVSVSTPREMPVRNLKKGPLYALPILSVARLRDGEGFPREAAIPRPPHPGPSTADPLLRVVEMDPGHGRSECPRGSSRPTGPGRKQRKGAEPEPTASVRPANSVYCAISISPHMLGLIRVSLGRSLTMPAALLDQ